MASTRILRIVFIAIAGLLFRYEGVLAQAGTEPDLLDMSPVRTPLTFGLKNGIGVNIILNNFGFGIGTEYRRVVGPYTELMAEFQFAALKDVREQTLQTWFGQQFIPNKYQRALTFPLLFGVKHRIFPSAVSDNFRIYVSGQVGPAFTFAYPYFSFEPNVSYVYNGDFGNVITGPLPVFADFLFPDQRVNEFFEGWDDGTWIKGSAGQFTIGADFGGNFKSLQSLRFGYYFHYYPRGIQIMEPVRLLGIIEDQNILVVEPAAGKNRFFGSPVITLVLGNMW